jgi:hypothetical protein
MSATKLLEQVKELPSRERKKLILAIMCLEKAKTASPLPRKRVKWPDVEARARRIFGERKVPNLVLMEREERTCIHGSSCESGE